MRGGSLIFRETDIEYMLIRRPWIHATILANGIIDNQKGLEIISSITRSSVIDGSWTIIYSRPHPAGTDYVPNMCLAHGHGFVYSAEKQHHT